MASDKKVAPEVALNLIVDAYEAALGEGLTPETVASAALSSALGLLVQVHGEDIVAKMLADIPDKIRKGQFTQAS